MAVRARRVPGSGAIEGTESCDVLLSIDDRVLNVECKARKKSGWKTLVKWRDGNDILVLQEMQSLPGQKKPAAEVLVGWELFAWLLERAARP